MVVKSEVHEEEYVWLVSGFVPAVKLIDEKENDREIIGDLVHGAFTAPTQQQAESRLKIEIAEKFPGRQASKIISMGIADEAMRAFLAEKGKTTG